MKTFQRSHQPVFNLRRSDLSGKPAMTSRARNVKAFWDEQARKYKTSPLATAPDTYYRDLEINRVIGYLSDGKTILDVGCGNGFSTIKFAEAFPRSRFRGVEYSEKMVEFANEQLQRRPDLKGRLSFSVGNVLSLAKDLRPLTKFDLIVSVRCLINLANWTEQTRALLELKGLLKRGGRIVLCENTQEGLQRLNLLRKRQKLQPISVRWHNYYMPQKRLLEFARKHFVVEDIQNIGSLYYIISRVVYAKLAALANQEPDYLNPINKIASELPSVGDWSPNYIFVLRCAGN